MEVGTGNAFVGRMETDKETASPLAERLTAMATMEMRLTAFPR